MRISFDSSFDLSNSGHCSCPACCEAFSALFYAAAEEVAAEEGTEIEVHSCTYNSPDTQGCDTSDEAVETWQAIHDRIVWAKRDYPSECASKQWTIDVDEGRLSLTPSGYRHYLVVEPEARRVYVFGCIGAGTPINVWHRLAETISLPGDVDGEQVADCLKTHKEQLDVIADSYLGSRWDGSNHVGQWDEGQDDARREARETIEHALEQLAHYWDAGEWLQSDVQRAISEAGAALASGQSLAEWAEAEVDRWAGEALLCAADLARALLSYVESDPDRLLTGDNPPVYVPGAVELAELAEVDLPALDTDDDDNDEGA